MLSSELVQEHYVMTVFRCLMFPTHLEYSLIKNHRYGLRKTSKIEATVKGESNLKEILMN